MPLEPKGELTFVHSKGLAVASDGEAIILSLAYHQPGQVTAFVSPEIHRQIGKQFHKNPELDAVVVTASLPSLVAESLEFLEDESLDRWLSSFEAAAES